MMQVLNLNFNRITSVGLADITWLTESTQLNTLKFSGNSIVYDDNKDAARHFLTMLYKNTTIQELGMLFQSAASIVCARNKSLTHVDLLLAQLTLQQQQQQHHQPPNGTTSTTTMWIKTCHKAIAKFAIVPLQCWSQCHCKLFQARPALLEKRLKRPPVATAAAASRGSQNGGGDGSINNNNCNKPGATGSSSSSSINISRRQMRQRL